MAGFLGPNSSGTDVIVKDGSLADPNCPSNHLLFSGAVTKKGCANADHSQRSPECKTKEDGEQPENRQGKPEDMWINGVLGAALHWNWCISCSACLSTS